MDEQGIVHCYARKVCGKYDYGNCSAGLSEENTISDYYSVENGGTYKTFMIIYTDTFTQSENNSVQSQFTIYYTESCEANTISFADEWGNPQYELGSGQQTIGVVSLT